MTKRNERFQGKGGKYRRYQVLPFLSFLTAYNMLLHLLILALVTQTIFNSYYLADPVKARGCSTNTVVIHFLFLNAPHSLNSQQ